MTFTRTRQAQSRSPAAPELRRAGYVPGQSPGAPCGERRQAVLWWQQLPDAQTQQRPMLLRAAKVPPEVEDGDLADFAAAPLAANQAEGETALAGAFRGRTADASGPAGRCRDSPCSNRT